MRKLFTLFSIFLFTLLANAQQVVFWSENFGTDAACSNQNQLATSAATTNGSWTQTITAAEGGVPNQWFVSATEAFTGTGNCGDGCLANPALDNQSLHVGSLGVGLCPTGDCGATYNAGANGETHKRIESPTINCTGKTNIVLTFDYMHFGELGTDAASLYYFDGTTWNALDVPLPQGACCGGPCGSLLVTPQWSPIPYNIALPAAANNNPNVKIGFTWDNNGNNSGADPSFAVDNIELSVACTTVVNNPAPIVGCNSVSYNSMMYYTSTTVSDTAFNGAANGCDSITNQVITINSTVVNNLTPIVGCDSVFYNSMMYYTSTTVSDTAFNGAANGCDSITNQVITINNTVMNNPAPIVGCDSVSYNSMMYYTSTTVSDTAFNGAANGCDSITNQVITINNTVMNNPAPIVGCDSVSYNSMMYYTSTTVSDTAFNGAANGCDSITNQVITINTVDVSVTVMNDSIMANATGASYQWLDCGNGLAIMPGETNQLFVATITGNYAVQVTQNGCVDTSVCNNIIITGITSNTFENDLKLYPNPNDGNFTIELNGLYESVQMNVYDLTGKRIAENNYTNKNQLNVNLTHLQNGTYLIELISNKGNRATIQILKK